MFILCRRAIKQAEELDHQSQLDLADMEDGAAITADGSSAALLGHTTDDHQHKTLYTSSLHNGLDSPSTSTQTNTLTEGTPLLGRTLPREAPMQSSSGSSSVMNTLSSLRGFGLLKSAFGFPSAATSNGNAENNSMEAAEFDTSSGGNGHGLGKANTNNGFELRHVTGQNGNSNGSSGSLLPTSSSAPLSTPSNIAAGSISLHERTNSGSVLPTSAAQLSHQLSAFLPGKVLPVKTTLTTPLHTRSNSKAKTSPRAADISGRTSPFLSTGNGAMVKGHRDEGIRDVELGETRAPPGSASRRRMSVVHSHDSEETLER